MSGRFFRGTRGATGLVFMLSVTVAVVVYWLNPPGRPTIDMAAMVAIGFLISGPVMLIGLHPLEEAPKNAAGTAAGFNRWSDSHHPRGRFVPSGLPCVGALQRQFAR